MQSFIKVDLANFEDLKVLIFQTLSDDNSIILNFEKRIYHLASNQLHKTLSIFIFFVVNGGIINNYQ